MESAHAHEVFAVHVVCLRRRLGSLSRQGERQLRESECSTEREHHDRPSAFRVHRGAARVDFSGNNCGPLISCATSFRGSYAFDATTAAGKVIYATLLAAYVSGKPIVARGTGACSNGLVEDLLVAYNVQ
jgi:hypothetical protein